MSEYYKTIYRPCLSDTVSVVSNIINVKHINKNDHNIESHFLKLLLNEFKNLHVCEPWRAYGRNI